jgi:alkyl hydroperoxide reductase 1
LYADTHPSISYIPWAEEQGDIKSCGFPINYNASKEWADKKVVVFALPGELSKLSCLRDMS